jgi:hypothetical protein
MDKRSHALGLTSLLIDAQDNLYLALLSVKVLYRSEMPGMTGIMSLKIPMQSSGLRGHRCLHWLWAALFELLHGAPHGPVVVV